MTSKAIEYAIIDDYRWVCEYLGLDNGLQATFAHTQGYYPCKVFIMDVNNGRLLVTFYAATGSPVTTPADMERAIISIHKWTSVMSRGSSNTFGPGAVLEWGITPTARK